ncbi:MAG: hypothetical protein QXU98_07480 [Candidatus Parvarchaeota archaeon]
MKTTRKNKNEEEAISEFVPNEDLINLIKQGLSFNKIIANHKNVLKSNGISLQKTKALRYLARASEYINNQDFVYRRKYKEIRYTTIKDRYDTGYQYLYKFKSIVFDTDKDLGDEAVEGGYVMTIPVTSQFEPMTYEEALEEAKNKLDFRLRGKSGQNHTELFLWRAYYFPHGTEKPPKNK